jgi:hypothetical protein
MTSTRLNSPIDDHLHLPRPILHCRYRTLCDLPVMLPQPPRRVRGRSDVGDVRPGLAPQEVTSVERWEGVVAVQQGGPDRLRGGGGHDKAFKV